MATKTAARLAHIRASRLLASPSTVRSQSAVEASAGRTLPAEPVT